MRDRIQDDLGRVAELVNQIAADAQNNLQGVGETIGHRLNLVTREEFEQIKTSVDLLRQRLDQLQQQIERLEQQE
ncbi:MAG: accessory factor UbiK family protein [Gammaproteobacteria bacterium]